MTQFIYVTEPKGINVDIAGEALAGTDWQLMPGNDTFTEGEPAKCQAVIIRTATTIGPDILQHFPDLKSVIRVGTGLDNVDVEFCKAHNIGVFNSPGANADAVAEYAVCMILYALRNLHNLNKADIVAWDRFKFTGRSLSTQTVGLVGYGNIGKLLHAKLVGLGCKKFYVYDPYVQHAEGAQLVTLPELMQRSTVVSLHLPLTPETKHVINAGMLQKLPEHAVLINAARGGVVDEQALLEVQKSKDLIYIADTVEGEPHINPELLSSKKVTITPHIAALTDEAEYQMITQAIGNFLKR